MASCCRRSSGVSPKLLHQLQEKLREVQNIFPGTMICTIINHAGELIVQYPAGNVGADDSLRIVSALNRAALQFGATLGQVYCPVVHVHGANHIFSCYDLGLTSPPNILAFYSEMDAVSVELFDTAQADERMVPIVEDLKLLLNNAAVA